MTSRILANEPDFQQLENALGEQPDGSEARVLFLDTMVYMHFAPVEDIDWCEVVDSSHVLVVVPMITIRELDTHKDHHPKRKIQDRARGVLQKFEHWFEAGGTQLRSGVRIEAFLRHPDLDYSALGLDRSRNDDLLIASMLEYRSEHPQADIVLVSQDTPPKLTARHHAFTAMSLPETMRVVVEADPLEKQVADLQRQLDRLNRALPRVELRFFGTAEGNRVIIRLAPPVEFSETLLGQKVEEKRRSLEWKEEAHYGLFQMAPANEATRYQREVQEYLPAFTEYLRAAWDELNRERRRATLELEMVNSGTAPADDVDLHLHFPDGFSLWKVGSDAEPSGPAPPKPPPPPRTWTQVMNEQIRPLSYDFSPMLPSNLGPVPKSAPNISGLRISRTSSYDVNLHVRRLKHGSDGVALPKLGIEFDDYARASSFQIEYVIRPANLPDAVSGVLHVLVEQG